MCIVLNYYLDRFELNVLNSMKLCEVVVQVHMYTILQLHQVSSKSDEKHVNITKHSKTLTNHCCLFQDSSNSNNFFGYRLS